MTEKELMAQAYINTNPGAQREHTINIMCDSLKLSHVKERKIDKITEMKFRKFACA